MHRPMRTSRAMVLGAAAAAIFFTTTYAQINDSIRGPASEANHFIETPKGWVHPKTPWGDPDIQAMLNMMQANSLNLERCVGGRPGGPRPRRSGTRAHRAGELRTGAPLWRDRPQPAAASNEPHRRSARWQASG